GPAQRLSWAICTRVRRHHELVEARGRPGSHPVMVAASASGGPAARAGAWQGAGRRGWARPGGRGGRGGRARGPGGGGGGGGRGGGSVSERGLWRGRGGRPPGPVTACPPVNRVTTTARRL